MYWRKGALLQTYILPSMYWGIRGSTVYLHHTEHVLRYGLYCLDLTEHVLRYGALLLTLTRHVLRYWALLTCILMSIFWDMGLYCWRACYWACTEVWDSTGTSRLTEHVLMYGALLFTCTSYWAWSSLHEFMIWIFLTHQRLQHFWIKLFFQNHPQKNYW